VDVRRLYNEFDRRPEFLEASRLGADFLRRFGRDPKGRIYFSLTREGQPFFYQRKAYAAVFYTVGLLEYSKASGDRDAFDDAARTFRQIVAWIENPALMDRPVLAGLPPLSNLANVMVLAAMAIEFAGVSDDPLYRRVMRDAIEAVGRHVDPQRRILLENVSLDGRPISAWPEGRLFNPGHSIEVAWFLMHLLEFFPDPARLALALDVLERSLEFAGTASSAGCSISWTSRAGRRSSSSPP